METTLGSVVDPAPTPRTPPVLRNLRRLEWYIRISGCVLVAVPGLMATFTVAASDAADASRSGGFSRNAVAAGALTCVLTLGCAAVQVIICHAAFCQLRSSAEDPLWRRPRILAAVGTSLACTVAVVLLAPGPLVAVPAATWLAMGLVGAFVPVLAWWRFLAAVGMIAGCCAIAAITLALLVGATTSGAVVGGVAGGLFYLATMWLNAWMMRVVWELDRLRQTAPQLAVAEERLRFSRDLHDTFGRTLSVVAVKSELATELARRGHAEQAAEEMAVVRGYRQTDLDQELQGARSILESAGISCSIDQDGSPSRRSGPVATTLAWVVREAATNVIRHSDATWCRLRLCTTPDAITLSIDNDGVASSADHDRGHGLVGLAERLRPAGGCLRHERGDGRFHLVATIPTLPERWPERP